MRHRAAGVLLVLVWGCQHPTPAPTPAYALRAGWGAHTARPDSDPGGSPFAEVGRARGMPPLRAVVLPDGTRELRMSDWYSMIVGHPVPMLRLVEGPSGATGEVIFFWTERPFELRRRPFTSCAPGSHGGRTCAYVVPPDRAPDWNEVAARLDSLGAWSIREPCEGNVRVTDSGELKVERLIGGHFEKYDCNAPTYPRQSAAALRAAAIYEYFESVVDNRLPPPT